MTKTSLLIKFTCTALVAFGSSACVKKNPGPNTLSFSECIEEQPIEGTSGVRAPALKEAYSNQAHLVTFRQKYNENSKITFDLNADEVNIADQIGTPFFTNHTFTVASLNEDSGVNPALTPRVLSIIGALEACRLKNDSLK